MSRFPGWYLSTIQQKFIFGLGKPTTTSPGPLPLSSSPIRANHCRRLTTPVRLIFTPYEPPQQLQGAPTPLGLAGVRLTGGTAAQRRGVLFAHTLFFSLLPCIYFYLASFPTIIYVARVRLRIHRLGAPIYTRQPLRWIGKSTILAGRCVGRLLNICRICLSSFSLNQKLYWSFNMTAVVGVAPSRMGE